MRRRSPAQGKRIRPGDVPARYTIFFDGCCEPTNPGGTAGFGFAIFENMHLQAVAPRVPVYEHSGMIEASPTTSNNVAEFLAVRQAFAWLTERGAGDDTIQFFGDSMLVIAILWGDPRSAKRSKWKIHGIDVKKEQKPGRYAEHAIACREALARFAKCQGYWIPREENSIADNLSKAELRRAGVEFRIQPEDDEEAA